MYAALSGKCLPDESYARGGKRKGAPVFVTVDTGLRAAKRS